EPAALSAAGVPAEVSAGAVGAPGVFADSAFSPVSPAARSKSAVVFDPPHAAAPRARTSTPARATTRFAWNVDRPNTPEPPRRTVSGMGADLGAQVAAKHVFVVELGRLAGERHLTLVEQVHVIGRRQRPGDVLLDQQ